MSIWIFGSPSHTRNSAHVIAAHTLRPQDALAHSPRFTLAYMCAYALHKTICVCPNFIAHPC